MPSLYDDLNYDIWLQHPSTGSAVKVGYRVARDEAGNLLLNEGLAPFAAPQQYQGAYTYESNSSNVTVPVAFEDWSGGCGFLAVPGSEAVSKTVYLISSGIDASWPNKLYLSPARQTGATTVQNPIKFVYSSLGLFVMTSRYVHEWTGAAWTERLDTGGTVTNTDLIEYTNSTGTYLILGVTGTSYYYSADGETWGTFVEGAVPAYRAHNAASGTGTSATVTKPTGTVDNDILIAVVSTRQTSSVGAPAGWSLLSGNGSGSAPTRAIYTFWKRASSEGGSYVFSWSTSALYRAVVTAYSGAITTGTPFDETGVTVHSTGTTSPDAPSKTAAATNRLSIVNIATSDAADSSISYTAPSGYTERYDGAGIVGIETSDKTASTGANDPGVATATVSSLGVAQHILLVPPTATGSTFNDISRFAIRGQANGSPLLWAVNSKGDMRNTEDPTDGSAWSAADAIQMGPTATISGLEVLNNVFYLYTSKGIISYDGTTVSTSWNNTSLTLESDAARPYTWVDRRTYFTYSGTLFHFDGDTTTIEKVWPRGGQEQSVDRNGTIVAITGDSKNLYFIVKTSGYIIMKMNPYVTKTLNGAVFTPAFDINTHSSNVSAALLVVPGASDTMHASNPQLVVGYGTNGDYYILTTNNMYPEEDSDYKFELSGTYTGTYIDVGARLFPKFLNSISFLNENLTADRTSQATALVILTDGTSTGQATSVATSNGITSTDVTTDFEFSRLRPRITLGTNTASSSPRTTGIIINTSLNPSRKRQWQITLEIDNDLERAGGGEGRNGARYLTEHLFNGLTERVVYYDRLGTSYITRILDVKGLVVGREKDLYQITLVQLV